MYRHIKKVFLYIAIVFFFNSCTTTNYVKTWEENKESIIHEYYAPKALDGSVYMYLEKMNDNKISYFYISYNFMNEDGKIFLEINDYDSDLRKICYKKLLIKKNSVNTIKYIVFTYDEMGIVEENQAEILSETDEEIVLNISDLYIENNNFVQNYYCETIITNIKKSQYMYNSKYIDTYIVEYKENYKQDLQTGIRYSKVIFGKNLCELYIEYYDYYHIKILERELIDILSNDEFIKMIDRSNT